MAIRERSGRKNSFLVYWKNPFTQKLESKSFARKEEAEKHNAWIRYRLIYERDSFRPAPEPVQEENIPQTLEGVFYLYLKERNLSKQNLSNTLNAVHPFIKKYGDYEIDTIDMGILQEMQKMCISAGNKGTTIRRRMGIIKAVLNWACKHSLLARTPAFPDIPKCETTRYIPPTPDEISIIYRASPEHLRRTVILGFMLGVRVGPSELFRLKWRDVNFQQGYIRVPNAKKGNADPWREVPINNAILPLFKWWYAEDEELGMEYIVHYHGKPISSVKNAWKKVLRDIHFDRHIRPYDLRHGFATEAIAAGGDYGTVGSIMGHKSSVMVLRHYQHIKDSRKQAIMEHLPVPNLDLAGMTKKTGATALTVTP